MAQVSITQLPQAQALVGTEAVPIVQNGVTVQTTTSAISGAGALNYPFLTVGSTSGLTQARQIAVGSGLSTADTGAGGVLTINLTGAAASLNSASNGLIVKTGTNTVLNRLIAVGSGMTVSNADGISGNPTLGLSTSLQNLSSLSGTGLMTINGTTFSQVTLQGTSNQITITNPNASTGSPTFSIASNPTLPGNSFVQLPAGTNAQRGSPAYGAFRYNNDIQSLEVYNNSGWNTVAAGTGVVTFSAGTTGFTPSTPTAGGIVLDGVLNSANGGTGVSGTLTGYVYGNGISPMTASTTIPTTALSGTITNAQLTNSAITINGNSVSLGSSTTVTASTTSSLTIGTGLSGTSFNGSTPVTITIDSTVATLTGTQTLTNKSISGSTNTFTNIPNSALTNNSITIGTTTVALGGTTLTPAGLTSVTVTQDPTTALQLATKQYVDNVAQGLDAKASVINATTVNLTATYNNGASGVGATLTNSGTLVAFSADSISNSVGDRVLVKNQTTAAQNGIYTVTTVGSGSVAWVLTRSTDMDQWAEVPNSFVFVEDGTIQADTGWVCTSNTGGTMGTTAITWVQFSGAGTYSAGTGLTLTGTQFSISNTAVTTGTYGNAARTITQTVNQQGQLTNIFDQPISITVSQLNNTGTGVGTALTTNVGSIGSFVVNGGALGTPSSGTLTNATGLPTTALTGTISNAQLANSSITINGNSVSLGGSTTVTATATNALTIGTGLSGTSYNGSTAVTIANTGVLSFSAGTTGLTPSTATTGAVTLGGTLNVGNGGIGVATLSGIAYGNGTSAFTAATAAQVVSVIGSTAVTNSTNAANVAVTTGAATTNYISFHTATTGNLPVLTDTNLTYNASTHALTSGISGGTF